MWQAGASIDLFKKNATLAVNVNDILNTGRWRWQVENAYIGDEWNVPMAAA